MYVCIGLSVTSTLTKLGSGCLPKDFCFGGVPQKRARDVCSGMINKGGYAELY